MLDIQYQFIGANRTNLKEKKVDFFTLQFRIRTSNCCFSLMTWSPLTVRGCRLSVVIVVKVRLHFSCPKTSDRLLYQSEAEQLLLERGLVVAEPEVPFFRDFFQGPLESMVRSQIGLRGLDV